MNNSFNAQLPALFELLSRWYVFFFLNVYGLGKIFGMQFYRRGNLPESVATVTLEAASAYELGWTFMGYSFGYILFIGSSQLLGAWMLLWPKTKLLGVGVLLPIMVNIIVFDLIFLDTKGALANATIYLLLLLYVLYFNRAKVAAAFISLTAGETNPATSGPKRWKSLVYVVLMAVLLFGFDQALVNLLGH